MHPQGEDPTGRDALERWATGALRQLPEPTAPGDLLHEVLRRVQEQEATPWHRRPWITWPAWLRWVSALGMGTALGLAWVQGTVVLEAARQGMSHLEPVRFIHEAGSGLLQAGSVLVGAMARAGRHLPHAWLFGVASVLGALWISTVGLGAALWRLLRPHP